jgi:hypothetical protein
MKPAAKSCAIVSLALVQLALPGCVQLAAPPTGARVANPAPAGRVTADSRQAPARAPADGRKVGDFSVHRFSGSYQKAPLTLTEEVVGQELGLWVIDYTFEEQAGTTKLRVRFNPRTDSVFSVAKLDAGRETNVPIALYEQLIDRTSFAADVNEGVIEKGRTTCLVGPNELACDTKTYRVRVGEKVGTLTVSRSEELARGDVTGDLIADDGTVIYHSELLEAGNTASKPRGVASR